MLTQSGKMLLEPIFILLRSNVMPKNNSKGKHAVKLSGSKFFSISKFTSILNNNIVKILAALYIVFILIIMVSSNWGVDPLHDGALFPTPVALAQGRVLFKDIQNQYGILQGAIEFVPILFFGPYLIITRIVGSIVIILISLFIYLCCKKFTNTKIALSISIFYLALTPNWNYAVTDDWPLARGAWPNLYGILFQLVFIYLYIRYVKEKKRSLLFYCGATLAISGLVRIEFLLASIIVFIWTTIFITKKDKITFFLSYLGVYLTVFLILTLQGSFKYMYEQIFQALFDTGENSVSFPSFSGIYKWIAVFLFVWIIILSLTYLFNRKILIIIILYPMILILNHSIYPNVKDKTGKVFSFLEIVSREIVLTPIAMLILFVIMHSLYRVAGFIRNIKQHSNYTNKITLFSPIYLLCITSLLQLHNLSYGYLYYIFPVYLVIFSIIYIDNWNSISISSKRINLLKTSKIIFTLTILLSLTNFSLAIEKNTQKFQAPILKFMQSRDSNTFTSINEITLFLSKISKNSTVSNNCSYALFSVNQNGYISNSRYPWSLLGLKQKNMKTLIDNQFPPDYYLICSSHSDSTIEDVIKNPNYKVIKKYSISKDESLTIFSNKIS